MKVELAFGGAYHARDALVEAYKKNIIHRASYLKHFGQEPTATLRVMGDQALAINALTEAMA